MAIEAYLGFSGGTATLHLAGEPDAADVAVLRQQLQEVADAAVNRLVLRVRGLSDLPPAALRALVATTQHSAMATEIIVVQPSERLRQSLVRSGLHDVVTVMHQA